MINQEKTAIILKFFYEVYNTLGYGFLEKVYENAMVIELRKQGLEVTAQAPITVFYEEHVVGEYFADLFVSNAVIVELKAAKDLADEHEAQLLNYLKATPHEVGLLLNFGPKPQFKRKAFENTRKEWWMQKNHPRQSASINSEAKGIVIFREWEGHDYLDAVLKMKENLPSLEFTLLVGEGEGENVWHFKGLLERGFGKSFSPPSIQSQEELAMLIYTSGTTGRPKGAMITHFQAVNGALQYSLGVRAASEDIFIGILPMSHSYGCGSTLILPTLLRSTLVLMDKFDAEKAFQLIEKERITLQLASPAHYILELNHPRRSNYDLSSLRAGLIAGQIAPEGLITRVMSCALFWLIAFAAAFGAFTLISLVIAVRGVAEIRELFTALEAERRRRNGRAA